MAKNSSNNKHNSSHLINQAIQDYDFLSQMYRDDYYPDFLVDKIKTILIGLCEKIEQNQPTNKVELLTLTHAATESINELEEEFYENDSELETVARECMADNFGFIVDAYGFSDVDVEDVIAPRDW